MTPAWLLRRCLLILYTLLVVSLLVFGITQLLPADAAVTLLGENATPDALAAVRAKLGLDQPAWLQYAHWLGGVVHGDFGASLRTGQPVGPSDDGGARSLAHAGGPRPGGDAGAGGPARHRRCAAAGAGGGRGGRARRPISASQSRNSSSPPCSCSGSPTVGSSCPRPAMCRSREDLADGLRHLVLPVLTVSVILIAHVSRMVRSEMIDVLHTDYIRAARLKGYRGAGSCSATRCATRCCRSSPSWRSMSAICSAAIIVVEEIFACPGIGRQLIVAIQARDLPAIQAGALIIAATYAIANFLADIAYALLDKRIRYD